MNVYIIPGQVHHECFGEHRFTFISNFSNIKLSTLLHHKLMHTPIVMSIGKYNIRVPFSNSSLINTFQR